MGRKKIRQQALARALHKSAPYVSRRMNGDVPFDADDLEVVAGVLGVTPHELLTQATAMPVLRPHSDVLRSPDRPALILIRGGRIDSPVRPRLPMQRPVTLGVTA